jgi:hypothetical protein
VKNASNTRSDNPFGDSILILASRQQLLECAELGVSLEARDDGIWWTWSILRPGEDDDAVHGPFTSVNVAMDHMRQYQLELYETERARARGRKKLEFEAVNLNHSFEDAHGEDHPNLIKLPLR